MVKRLNESCFNLFPSRCWIYINNSKHYGNRWSIFFVWRDAIVIWMKLYFKEERYPVPTSEGKIYVKETWIISLSVYFCMCLTFTTSVLACWNSSLNVKRSTNETNLIIPQQKIYLACNKEFLFSRSFTP